MNKEKRNLVLYLTGLFGLATATTIYTGNPWVSGVLTGSLSLMAFMGRFIQDSMKKKEEDDKKDLDNNSSVSTGDMCRILLYGMPGSGKTTIVENLATRGIPKALEPTRMFGVHTLELSLELNGPKQHIIFADYKGEEPDQILDEDQIKDDKRAIEFFGPSGNRLVNAIFFVVDLFPAAPNKKKNPIEYQNFIDTYNSSEAVAKIKERVDVNLRYINEFYIKPPLRIAYSKKNLYCVKLLINKKDILSDIIFQGYLLDKDLSAMDDFVKDLYQIPIRALKKACESNNIDFSVELLSAIEKGEKLEEIFEEILNEYIKKRK